MEIVRFDSGFRWDDKNIRWGDPAYRLNPGDPGYVFDPNNPQTDNRKKGKIMAGNPTPKNQDVLLALGEDIADGIALHGAAIGIAQNTEAKVRADIAALRAAEATFAAKKAAEVDAGKAVTTANKNGTTFIQEVAAYLRRKLSQRWTIAWEPTGFPTGSTAVPGDQGDRLTLLGKLKDYFTKFPAMEVNTPNMVLTAARANTLFEALSDARAADRAAASERDAAGTARDTAFKALSKRVSKTIEEIGGLIGPDDYRWPALGLSKPSDPDLPLPVSQITAIAAQPGEINGTIKRALRAELPGDGSIEIPVTILQRNIFRQIHPIRCP